MKKVFVLIFSLIILSILSGLSFASVPDTISMYAKNGNVEFNHLKHSKTIECSSCHHVGDQVKCSKCHGVNANAPNAKKAMHKNCKGCHKSLKQGPTKCKECHVKQRI